MYPLTRIDTTDSSVEQTEDRAAQVARELQQAIEGGGDGPNDGANSETVRILISPLPPQPHVAHKAGPVQQLCRDVAYGVKHFDVGAVVSNQAFDTACDFFLPGYASSAMKVTRGLVSTPTKDRQLVEQGQKIEVLEAENRALKCQLIRMTESMRQVGLDLEPLVTEKSSKRSPR